jgi:hypothetical protein
MDDNASKTRRREDFPTYQAPTVTDVGSLVELTAGDKHEPNFDGSKGWAGGNFPSS